VAPTTTGSDDLPRNVIGSGADNAELVRRPGDRPGAEATEATEAIEAS
jgi:hypothetical protein